MEFNVKIHCEINVKLVFMKYSERKISWCILPFRDKKFLTFWKSTKKKLKSSKGIWVKEKPTNFTKLTKYFVCDYLILNFFSVMKAKKQPFEIGVQNIEAATGGVLWKDLFLQISQYSQGNTCVFYRTYQDDCSRRFEEIPFRYFTW